jgi:probable rRNA maturation factor
MAAGLSCCKGERQERAIRGQDAGPDRQRILHLRNRHPVCSVRLGLLRRISRALLEAAWRDGSFDLAIDLVGAPEMTRLNEAFLRHKGSTDVITFDYAERAEQGARPSRVPVPSGRIGDRRDVSPALLHGEIVVCLDEAVCQARRFHTTWQSELVRYVVHGVLHLLGYDDQGSRARRRMKAAEDALVRQLARRFVFSALSRTWKGRVTDV